MSDTYFVVFGSLAMGLAIWVCVDIYRIYRREKPVNTHEQIRHHRNDAVALSQQPFKGSLHLKNKEEDQARGGSQRRSAVLPYRIERRG